LDIGPRLDPTISPTSPATNTNQSRSSSLTSSAAMTITSPEPLANQPTQINGVLTSNLAPGLGKGRVYEPRIYGFRVSERAKSGPRMKWLRMKPDDINELNEAAIYHATHGGDEEGGDDGDTEMSTVGATAQQSAISRRKKAPLRRRRAAASTNADQMSLNGGEAG
jgi:Casein kinase II, beta subunit